MNLTLKRTRIDLYGVFSGVPELTLVGLEHSFPVGLKDFAPKLPPGVYNCKRGVHELKARIPFETFEITGVVGHTGILFHKGNTNNDSEGCVLLGLKINALGIEESRIAFEKFMAAQEGCQEFLLTVVGLQATI